MSYRKESFDTWIKQLYICNLRSFANSQLIIGELTMSAKTTLFSIALAVSVNCFAEEPQPTEDSAESLIEAYLIKTAIENMKNNIAASKRESGEIDKLIRALSGVSVKDIEKYGICGGKNSEVRKLAGSLCNDIK